MPKLLFSKIRIYELKDIPQNRTQRRRIDILLSRKRQKKDIQCILAQKINDESFSTKIKVPCSLPSLPAVRIQWGEYWILASMQRLQKDHLTGWPVLESNRDLPGVPPSPGPERDQRWPPHPREDQKVHESPCSMLLWRGSETCVQTDGERLVFQVPQVRCLPGAQTQSQDLLVEVTGQEFVNQNSPSPNKEDSKRVMETWDFRSWG